jgi:UDP-GlcNAc:undecaprenyl-phosphate/decaprenyl-phosphate GlcNAc-1-phosphate transferase
VHNDDPTSKDQKKLSMNDLMKYILFSAGPLAFSYCIILFLLKSSVVKLFIDKPDARKMHHQPIPRLGGVVIILTFLVFTLAAYTFNNQTQLLSTVSVTTLTAFIMASLVIFSFGFFDDTTFVTVRVRHKLFAELLIAFITVYILDVNIGKLSVFGMAILPEWISDIISFLWIVGIINAFNIVDGLDGLAGSITLIALLSLAAIAGLAGQSSIVLLCLILSGAVAGFLFLNLPPAKTFMGDSGSLFLGTMIAILSLFIGREVVLSRAIVVMPLIAGIPIIEVFTTMVRRYFRAKDKKNNQAGRIHSMVIPDNSHMHHRFTYRGYFPLQTTTILCTLSVTLCCGAICIHLAPPEAIGPLCCYLVLPVVLTLDRLGFGGRFKKALHLSSSRYNGFKKTSLIAVVDGEEDLMHLLEKRRPEEISYIRLSNRELPKVAPYLRTAVMQNNQTDLFGATLKKAEQISAMISRPVFILSPDRQSGLFVQEVSKNGSLTIRERNISVNELMRDFRRLSSTGKIKHPQQITSGGQNSGFHLVESYAHT